MKKSYLVDVPRRWLDIGLSAFSILCGAALLIYMPTQKWWKPESPPSTNPGFFPNLVARGLIIIGLVLMVRSIARFKAEKGAVTINLLSAVILGVWWIYAMAMPYLGFIISSILVLAVSMVIWGVKNKKVIILYSVIVPIVLYLLLAVVLNVNFPTLIL